MTRMTRKDFARAGVPVPKMAKTGKNPAVKRDTKAEQRMFLELCKAHGLPEPTAEFRFHETRDWRFDFAWSIRWNPASIPDIPDAFNFRNIRVALEIDGGAWSQGRHTRGKGFIEDQKKLNEAVLLGWRVFRCTPQDVSSGEIFETLKKALL